MNAAHEAVDNFDNNAFSELPKEDPELYNNLQAREEYYASEVSLEDKKAEVEKELNE